MIKFVIIILICHLDHIFCYKTPEWTENKHVNFTKLKNQNDHKQAEETRRYRLPVHLLGTRDQVTSSFAQPMPWKKAFAYSYPGITNELRNIRIAHRDLKRAIDEKKLPNYLRLYFCGTGYQNCMYDERLNNVRAQHDFLKQIPRMADITVPSHYIDWKSKQLHLPADVNIRNNVNLSGRREGPLFAEEPHYVLVRSDGESPQHLALLSGPDYTDDPFIPQRGRRWSHPHVPPNTNTATVPVSLSSQISPLMEPLSLSDIRYMDTAPLFSLPITVRKKRNAPINSDNANGSPVLGMSPHILKQKLNKLIDESRWQQIRKLKPHHEIDAIPMPLSMLIKDRSQNGAQQAKQPLIVPSRDVLNGINKNLLNENSVAANDYDQYNDYYEDGSVSGIKNNPSKTFYNRRYDNHDDSIPMNFNTLWYNNNNRQRWLNNLSTQNRDIYY